MLPHCELSAWGGGLNQQNKNFGKVYSTTMFELQMKTVFIHVLFSCYVFNWTGGRCTPAPQLLSRTGVNDCTEEQSTRETSVSLTLKVSHGNRMRKASSNWLMEHFQKCSFC